MEIYWNEVENNKIASHDSAGRVQCKSKFIKKVEGEKLILLTGYITLSDGTDKRFKRGWYNQDLEFISDITEQDQELINNSLPF